MLKKSLLPNSAKHIENFQLDYPTRRKLMVAAVVLQTISLISGGYGLTPFLQQLASELLPVQYSQVAGSMLGFSIAFAVEFLIYILISYIVFVIPTNYLKEEGKVAKVYAYIQFVGGCVLLIGLVLFSMFISKKAVSLQIEATKFHTFDYAQFQEKEEEKIGKIDDTYKSDLNRLEQRRGNAMESIKTAKQAKIKAVESEKNILLRSEERTGKKYTTRKLLLEQRIAKIEEEAAGDLILVNEKYDNEAAKLRKSKEVEVGRVQSAISESKDIAKEEEGRIAEAKEEQKVFVAALITWIAQFAVVGAVICLLWVKMSEVRSGQEQTTFALPENFQSKWYYELYILITLVPTRFIQNLTRKGLKKVPTLIELEEAGAIVPIGGGDGDGGGGVRKNGKENPGQSGTEKVKKAVKVKNDVKVKKEYFEQLNAVPQISNLSDGDGNVVAIIGTPKKRAKNGKKGRIMPKSDKSAYVEAQKESVRKGYTELLRVGKKKPKIKEVAAAVGIGEKTVSKYLKMLRSEAAI